jgi:glycosyltransferase involved in cell wall biosynthesis
MNILIWGTFGSDKPRNQVLLSGLKESKHLVEVCHHSVWENVGDKSQVRSLVYIAKIALRYLCAYPILVYRYLFRTKPHDVILIGYMGVFDVLVLWPFARLFRKPIVLDAFLSIYDTTVVDRRLLKPSQFFAKLLYFVERLAYKAADLVVIDTDQHREYLVDLFKLDELHVCRSFVGACNHFFHERILRAPEKDEPIKVIFYGTFVPLQGVSFILEAAKLTPPELAHWWIIGKGQDSAQLDARFSQEQLPNVTRIKWLSEDDLRKLMEDSDVALGIFGNTAKASRVIPIKFFESFALGLPLITMDSPAIRELIPEACEGLWFIPPANPQALSDAVVEASKSLRDLQNTVLYGSLKNEALPKTIALDLVKTIEDRVLNTKEL